MRRTCNAGRVCCSSIRQSHFQKSYNYKFRTTSVLCCRRDTLQEVLHGTPATIEIVDRFLRSLKSYRNFRGEEAKEQSRICIMPMEFHNRAKADEDSDAWLSTAVQNLLFLASAHSLEIQCKFRFIIICFQMICLSENNEIFLFKCEPVLSEVHF